MKKEKRVSKALSLLYKNALEARENTEVHKDLSDLQYIKEYGTIKLCSYRQAGHTHSIVDLVEKNPNEYFSILSLGPNGWKEYLRKILEVNINRENLNWEFTNISYVIGPLSRGENKKLNPDCLRGMHDRTIIVDMASCVRHQDIADIPHYLNKSNILIYLQ